MMKTIASGVIAAAALIAASFVVTPCTAMPMARLSPASVETSIVKINGVRVRHHHRHHYYYRPLLYVAPGLYYGCRSGWYCFGPPYRSNFRLAWYGGFNSQYGYQGARYRAQPRTSDTSDTPRPATTTPPPPPPSPSEQETPPATKQ